VLSGTIKGIALVVGELAELFSFASPQEIIKKDAVVIINARTFM
jgi:hypothetical protein